MEQFTKVLKEYLKDRRNYEKVVFKTMGTIWRGVNNKFTLEQVELKLFGKVL